MITELSNHRAREYKALIQRLASLVENETDPITLMATIACELHHGLDHFHWTGFYRVVAPGMLKIGPYQGGHGCLAIPFSRGICGRCARDGQILIIGDVSAESDHIACSSTTRSEIVLPVFDSRGRLRAVMDIDSDFADAFDETDACFLEQICSWMAAEAIEWGKFPGDPTN